MKPLLVAFALGCLALFGAGTARGGEISGTVVEQPRGEGVAKQEVLLFWRGTEKQAGRVISNNDGRYRFDEVDPGSYLVSVPYLGIPYVANDVVVSEESPRATADIEVYQSTTADDDVIVRADHLILQTSEQGVRVTEVIILDNLGDRTYLGEVSPASPTGHGIFIPLPEGFVELSAPAWLEQLIFNPTENGFHLALAIRPGASQITLSYGLQRGLPGASLDRRFSLDVKAVNVAVPLDAGMQVRSADLSEGKLVEIEGRRFLVSSGGPFARNTLFKARAGRGSIGSGFSRRNTTWGLCGLFTIGLGLMWVVHRGRQPAGGDGE